MGVRFGAGAADDDFHPVTDGIDQAAVAGGKGDGEEVGFTWLAEGQGIAFGVGGEATTEVAVQGLVLGQVDAGRLAVEADPADTPFLAQDGATDLVIAVGAGGGGGLGEAEGELDPFVFHRRGLFFRDVEAVEDAVENGGQDDSEEGDQDEAAEEGVAGGEKLCRCGGHFVSVDGAHSAHQHRGLQHGLIPGESSDLGVAEDSDAHGHSQNPQGHGEVEEHASEKDPLGGHGLAVVLVGMRREGHGRGVADMRYDGKRWEGAMGKRGEKVGVWDGKLTHNR